MLYNIEFYTATKQRKSEKTKLSLSIQIYPNINFIKLLSYKKHIQDKHTKNIDKHKKIRHTHSTKGIGFNLKGLAIHEIV